MLAVYIHQLCRMHLHSGREPVLTTQIIKCDWLIMTQLLKLEYEHVEAFQLVVSDACTAELLVNMSLFS